MYNKIVLHICMVSKLVLLYHTSIKTSHIYILCRCITNSQLRVVSRNAVLQGRAFEDSIKCNVPDNNLSISVEIIP